MHTFKENLKPSYGAYSTNLGAETSDKVESAVFVEMESYDSVWLIAQAIGAASGEVISLIALEATAANGGGSATTSKTDTFTSTDATDTDVLQVEIKAAELSSGYKYVGLRITTSAASGTPVVSGMIVQGNPRYAQATLV